MIIASQKRKENIAEYLLYMWQIEDLIRANGLDLDKIKASIINPYPVDDATKHQITEWYESLIDMMRREDVAEKGHLQMNKNIIGSLADLNRRVMADHRFVDYHKEFYATLPYIVELRARAAVIPGGAQAYRGVGIDKQGHDTDSAIHSPAVEVFLPRRARPTFQRRKRRVRLIID